MRIETAELRAALETVLTHVESQYGESLDVPYDFFWVSGGDAYNSPTPPAPTVGQISETWENLARSRIGDGDSTINYELVWLGDVLRAIGHSHPEAPS